MNPVIGHDLGKDGIVTFNSDKNKKVRSEGLEIYYH